MRLGVLIPAYQAARSLEDVIRRTRTVVPEAEVLVVDDGSSDGSGEAAVRAGARVLTHAENFGKGDALRSGFADLLPRTDAIATLDADGQHFPEDLPPLVAALERTGAAICVGSRMGDTRLMPGHRKIANQWGSALISWLAGAPLEDTQSGYRVYRSSALPQFMGTARGYDYESEVLIRACRMGMLVTFEPVTTHYGDERSHFRPLRDGLRFARLIARNLPGAFIRPASRHAP